MMKLLFLSQNIPDMKVRKKLFFLHHLQLFHRSVNPGGHVADLSSLYMYKYISLSLKCDQNCRKMRKSTNFQSTPHFLSHDHTSGKKISIFAVNKQCKKKYFNTKRFMSPPFGHVRHPHYPHRQTIQERFRSPSQLTHFSYWSCFCIFCTS